MNDDQTDIIRLAADQAKDERIKELEEAVRVLTDLAFAEKREAADKNNVVFIAKRMAGWPL
jgi:hypothetical protein